MEAQRMRIISATIEVAWERGSDSITISRIVGRAGVSRRTFYELFESRDECMLAAIEDTLELASERVQAACRSHERWLDRVRAGLGELLWFCEEEPQRAWLAVVHSAGAGPAVLQLRWQVLDRLGRIVDEARAKGRAGPPPLTAEGVVGGVLSVIQGQLIRTGSSGLIELLNPLTSMVVLPYRGDAAARRELSRAKLAPRAGANLSSAADALPGLNLRLTYRTLAVLGVVASEPGLSNRDICQRADVTDEGQISRLLARLCDRGLLENTGGGQPLGAANAWRLTPGGEALERAIRRGHSHP
jgi:AcrR family transcriptional regulator